MTILASMLIALSALRIAAHAARSAIRSSPFPMKRAAASAAASVARATSSARLRSIYDAPPVGSVRQIRLIRFDHTAARKQRIDEPIAVRERGAGRLRIGLGIAPRIRARISKTPIRYYRKWNRLARMGFDFTGGRMVRLQEQAELAHLRKPVEHRPEDQLVDALDGFLLQIGAAHL